MVAMGRGGGKTPERVVQLIKDEIAKNGQNATARAIGLPLYSIQKYMKGVAEPSQATLDKLAGYFEKSVAWLRGSGLQRTKPHNKEILDYIRTTIANEYSSIHAENMLSVLQLDEEENYKLADLLHDSFM